MACRITHFPKLAGLWSFAVMCGPWDIMEQQKKNSAHCTYATMPDCNSAAAPYKFQDGRKKWPSSQNFSSAGMSDFSTHVPFQFNVAGIHPTHHVHGTSPLLLDKDLKLRTSNAWQEKTKKKTAHTNNKQQHHHHQQQQQPPCTTKNGAIKKSTVDLLSSIEASKESESPVMSSSTM